MNTRLRKDSKFPSAFLVLESGEYFILWSQNEGDSYSDDHIMIVAKEEIEISIFPGCLLAESSKPAVLF